MNAKLAERLNQVLPRITSPSLLSSEGIGNEIACYIFDYPAESELQVREHLRVLESRLASHHEELRVLHLNLLDVTLAYLEQRGLLEKAIAMQARKGDVGVLSALKGPLAAEKLCEHMRQEHRLADHDLVLLSGVGSIWPMLRAHSLLNCLHTVMAGTPLVMFYPGSFDGTALRLFGQIAASTTAGGTRRYYRAFTLISGE